MANKVKKRARIGCLVIAAATVVLLGKDTHAAPITTSFVDAGVVASAANPAQHGGENDSLTITDGGINPTHAAIGFVRSPQQTAGISGMTSGVLSLSPGTDEGSSAVTVAPMGWIIDQAAATGSRSRVRSTIPPFHIARNPSAFGQPSSSTSIIPVPMTLSFLGAGLLGLGIAARRHQRVQGTDGRL